MNFATHIDFLIFGRLDKMPVLAIEVDGYAFHGKNSDQHKRDMMKNANTSKIRNTDNEIQHDRQR